MKRRVIAAITAAAVAISTVAPTTAGAWGRNEQDALKFALGGIALGLILNEATKDQRQTKSYTYQRPTPVRGGKVIPGECLYRVKTNAGPRDVVSSSCMADFGLSRNLPRECAFDIRGYDGRSKVYGPRCLGQYGWRVSQSRY